jgi:hypothetical protein
MKQSYIPQNKRKKILFIADDIRTTSGIAGIAREIVVGTAGHYNWCCIGGSIQHPEAGKQLDLSEDTNKYAGISDSYVKLYPTNGYGDIGLIRQLIELEKPDAIMFFTDPRYFVWLFQAENEFRTKIPFLYLNIWDDLPAPLYNEPYYESCDLLMAISKQTFNINKIVLGDKAKSKVLKYIPHGINSKFFFPIDVNHEKYNDLLQFKDKLFNGKKYEFVLVYNARNIRRKSTPDLMLAYKVFCDTIGPEKASKCALVLHTQPVDEFGTDLPVVKELINEDHINIIFSQERFGIDQMNYLYNSGDATILISSNEGWGLSTTEGMMCGKMMIGNVTGGIQDQMRFADEEGNWIDFNENFCSNHFGTYRNHGSWAVPVFPNNMSLVGSIPTPYIFDDRVDFRDVADAINTVYNLNPNDRKQLGMKAHEWVMGEESKMEASKMCDSIVEAVNETFTTWKPRSNYEFIKIQEYPKKKIRHKLVY